MKCTWTIHTSNMGGPRRRYKRSNTVFLFSRFYFFCLFVYLFGLLRRTCVYISVLLCNGYFTFIHPQCSVTYTEWCQWSGCCIHLHINWLFISVIECNRNFEMYNDTIVLIKAKFVQRYFIISIQSMFSSRLSLYHYLIPVPLETHVCHKNVDKLLNLADFEQFLII